MLPAKLYLRVSRYTAQLIDSTAQLRAAADAWDDLWRRSRLTRPTLRAAHLAMWLDEFATDRPFRAVVVTENVETDHLAAGLTPRFSRLVAALPLVERRLAGMKRVGTLPANEWAVCGELLLDPQTDQRSVLDVLFAVLRGGCKQPPSLADRENTQRCRRLPWPMLKLDDVEPTANHWQCFVQAAARAGAAISYRPWLDVGHIDTTGDWEAYRASWSKRHRQQLSRHLRRLHERGEVALRWLDRLEPEDVPQWLRVGWQLEDRGWKGARRTSVLSTPGMVEFYERQACDLAISGELVLAILEVDGLPIAFAYGMAAKGVYRSLKVGYDPAWGEFGPGQLLRLMSFERMFRDPVCRAIESISPTPTHVRWRPQLYEIGRLLVAVRGVVDRCLVRAEKVLRG